MEHVERICMAATNDQLDEIAEKLSGLSVYEEVVELLNNTVSVFNIIFI